MKKGKIIITSILLGIMCTGVYKNACAAEVYTPRELVTNRIVNFDSNAFVEGNSIVTINNKISKGKNKESKISITFVSEEGNVTENVIKKKGEVIPIVWKDSRLYARSEKNKKITISIMDKKGKVEKTYSIKPKYENKAKIKKVAIYDLKVKGNKIYYLMRTADKKNNQKKYIQTYDIKKNKVVNSKNISVDDRYTYLGNSLYRCEYGKKCFIKEYSLDGKKLLNSYQLPCTKEDFIVDAHPWKNEYTTPYNFGGTVIKGKYIYLINKKGIFRLNKNKSNEFELIYDGSNDNIFNPPLGEELNMDNFGMFDNGDLYMLFANYDNSILKNVIYKNSKNIE